MNLDPERHIISSCSVQSCKYYKYGVNVSHGYCDECFLRACMTIQKVTQDDLLIITDDSIFENLYREVPSSRSSPSWGARMTGRNAL